jgi:hypothetical protein
MGDGHQGARGLDPRHIGVSPRPALRGAQGLDEGGEPRRRFLARALCLLR